MERHFPHGTGTVPERCGEKDGSKRRYVVDSAMEYVKNQQIGFD